MKIAIIVSYDISEDNGITIRAKRVFNALKNDHDVHIVYSKKKNLNNIFSVLFNDLIWNLKLLLLIPRMSNDLIYLSSDFLGFFSVFILSKILKFNIIFEAHGVFSDENITKKRNKLIIKGTQTIERFVITRSDYVIALSKNIFEFYKKFNENIELIPVFIDESIRIKRKEKLNNEYKLIGLIGPFDMPANKYYLDFIYKNIDKLNENLIISIIGSCKNKIKNNKIIYTGYIKSYPDYLSEVKSLDIILIPSKISTSGPLNKILEAMLCQTPVLTTPEGTHGLDYIKNYENIIIEKEEKLIELLNGKLFNGQLLEKTSINARKLINDYYSKKINEEKLLNVINTLL